MVDVRDPSSDAAHPRPESHFADANRRGGVMFISQPKGLPSACWGGLMSTRAMALGAEAVVVDGRVRDVGEHRNMGFPVRIDCLSFSFSFGFISV
jgi:regulator of RNase E activity RraA